MILFSKIANNKKYPEFIRNHEIFTHFKGVKKKFAELSIKDNTSLKISALNSASFLKQLKTSYSCSDHDCFEDTLMDKLYNKVTKINSKEELVKLISESFGAYFPADFLNTVKNYKVVFSADPWDIATMSMRGTESCQAWGRSQCKALVGSITDPYCGIIYITDGKKTPYGPRMLARSVVRCIGKNGSYIYIENPYVDENYFSGEQQEDYFFIIFNHFFKKLNNKLITNKYGDVPLSLTTVFLMEKYSGHNSYMDNSAYSGNDDDVVNDNLTQLHPKKKPAIKASPKKAAVKLKVARR